MNDRKSLGRSFRNAAAFRAWLEDHHASESELVLRLYKVHAKQKGMTYTEALDEALCFGWIDGVRRGGDADSFDIRFTPRTSKSTWSALNIKRVTELEATGRMHESGLAAFRRRSGAKSGIYAYENRQTALAPKYQKKLRANARKEETRERRLASLIQFSSNGKRLPQLDRKKI